MKRKQHTNSRRLRQIAHDYRPGPSETGMGMWSPMPMAGPPVDPAVLENQVDAIVNTVESRNLVTRNSLYNLLSGAQWGPGQFRRAVRVALDRGLIRQMSGVLYASHLAADQTEPDADANDSNSGRGKLREVGRQEMNREPAGV